MNWSDSFRGGQCGARRAGTWAYLTALMIRVARAIPLRGVSEAGEVYEGAQIAAARSACRARRRGDTSAFVGGLAY